ncbi:unnamed protein product [Gordionus sp. m RMFG-2023]|uniref:STAM-binding protein-like n=1 Tax=Gordionus sp. m RMFG-2023 TaxID=3053472 RepID=UPI0030E2EA3D
MSTKDSDHFSPEYRIKQLFQDVEINPQCPLIRYFRSGPEMISMAKIYEKEGDIEKAFMLYYKYITLFLEKLPDIPQYKDIPTLEKISVKNALKEVLPKAEQLKDKIYSKYHNEYIEKQKQIEKTIKEEVLSREKSQPSIKMNTINNNNENELDNYNISNSLKNYANTNTSQNNLSHSNINFNQISVPSRSLKPQNLIDSSISNQSNRTGYQSLRQVRVPKNLALIFLSLAESNTDKNIETGGHLFGKLSQNVFTITHLVIPKQTGQPNSFLATSEEEMVYFKESKNLLTLGWIHTHPSQTAFLSSVDLHNQFPNQQLLPEYIAIVCSPSHNEVKIFTITTDFGMNVLATCKEQGFHYHSQSPPLYEECKHIVLEPHLDVVVEDMRKL